MEIVLTREGREHRWKFPEEQLPSFVGERVRFHTGGFFRFRLLSARDARLILWEHGSIGDGLLQISFDENLVQVRLPFPPLLSADDILAGPHLLQELRMYVVSGHQFTLPLSNGRHRQVLIYFGDDCARQLLQVLPAFPLQTVPSFAAGPPEFALSPTAPLFKILLRLCAIVPGAAPWQVYFEAKYKELLALLLQQVRKTTPLRAPLNEEDREHMLRVYQIIAANLMEPYSVPHLAKMAHMGTARLRRLFKQQFGISIHGLLKQLRMQKALHLVTQTSQPITDIAAELGFKNTSNFSAEFKSYYGRPPQSFRKS
jgi:AraC-like DNA-binding protein